MGAPRPPQQPAYVVCRSQEEMMMAKINVLLRTSEYRGDHSADLALAFDVKPGETVEALMQRMIAYSGRSHVWVELRQVIED